MKLHLGCYHRKIYGYVNVDIRADVQPDLVADAFTLDGIQNETVDVIYVCHMLEHVKRSGYQQVLKRWFEVLKPHGILRISVPDMQAICKYYLEHGGLRELQNQFFGSQRHDYDFHYIAFDFDMLREDLLGVGFTNVVRYDWRTTEHFYVDDYSQAYLPQISYKTRRPDGIIEGTHVSLNIEATK